MRIMVVGSTRCNLTDKDIVWTTLNRWGPTITSLILTDSPGIGDFAKEWSDGAGYLEDGLVEIYEGYEDEDELFDLANPDIIVVFIGSEPQESRNVIEYAIKKRIPVEIVPLVVGELRLTYAQTKAAVYYNCTAREFPHAGTTGDDLRKVWGVPEDYHLWLEHPTGDRLIEGTQPVELWPNAGLYCAPKKIG